MNIIEKVKKNIKKIVPEKMYSVAEIAKLDIIFNTKFESSVFTIYRIVNKGLIPSIDMGTGTGDKKFRYVKGSDLITYAKERYKLN